MTGLSRPRTTLPAALVLLALALFAGRASAQSTTFQNTLEAYLMGASMSGTVGAGPISTEIDVPSSTILGNLKFGALLDYRGEAPKWAVVADVVYMNLGKAGTSDGGRVSVDVGAEEFIVDLVGAYRVSKAFEVLGGLRYTALGTTMTLYGPLDTREARVNKSWVDPVVGGQAFLPLSDAFQFQLRGDIGGFGVGCKFTWQATVRVNWQVSRAVRVGIGYRWLNQDYESGSGSDTFKWNVLSQGPLVAAGLKF
jgi:hypothetical protein